MTLRELERLIAGRGFAEIEVHAVDPVIYLIFQRFGERLTPVTARSGETARYTSRYAALKAMAAIGLDEVIFVHRSAYGEMIGSEGDAEATELRQQVRIAHLRD
jgi:hypothetical protein